MIDIKELRNDAKTAHYGHLPLEVSGSEMLELLDRLEAAEKADTEAYQRGYETGQEEIEKERDALRAKLEAAEKNNSAWLYANAPGGWIDNLRVENEAAETAWKETDKACRDLTEKVIPNLRESLEAAEKEREELHALIAAVKKQANAEFRIRVKKEEACARLQSKIEAMERQEPVAWLSSRNGFICKENKNPDYNVPLYALPGAQPAPSVPMDVIADYLVSISAHIAHQDDAKAQAEIGELLKMIAAAPEAKP